MRMPDIVLRSYDLPLYVSDLNLKRLTAPEPQWYQKCANAMACSNLSMLSAIVNQLPVSPLPLSLVQVAEHSACRGTLSSVILRAWKQQLVYRLSEVTAYLWWVGARLPVRVSIDDIRISRSFPALLSC